MLGDQRPHLLNVLVAELLELDQFEVAAAVETTIDVVHVRDPTAHPGGEVAPGAAEHDHAATCHVLAAVVADALDHRERARVAHRKALARESAEERATGGRPIKDGVAHEHVLLGAEAGALGRADRHHSAGQSFAGVVVGFAAQREGDARSEPGGEALTGRAREGDLDRAFRQPVRPVAPSDLAREYAADGAVDVTDRHRAQLDRLRVLQRGRASLDEVPIERVLQHGYLRARAAARRVGGQLGHCQDHREIDVAPLPVVDRLAHVEQVGASDQILEPAHAETGHDLPHLLGDQHQVVDGLLGRAAEALAQLGILGGDPDRAGVQVADAHHDAAHRDQRRG